MALEDRFMPFIQPHLEPGEQVQKVIIGQTMSGWWSVISYWILIVKGGYRVVVATDRRLLVFPRNKMKKGIGELIRVLPRQTKIGPAKGVFYKTNALGEKLYFGFAFKKRIAEIDALGGN